MSRSATAVKEAREPKPARRQQVNLCGACGEEISASELLCKDCRHTMGGVQPEASVEYTSVWGD